MIRLLIGILILLAFAIPAEAQRACDQVTSFFHTAPTGPVQIVPPNPSQRVYFCGFVISQRGQSLDFHVTLGQGTNCQNNPTEIVNLVFPSDVVLSNRIGTVGPSGDYGYGLCLQTTGQGGLGGILYWAQF